MNYLSFISNEHLYKCIYELYKEYLKCHEETTLKKFYKNKVDPIKFNFDMQFNNIDIEEYINYEINRQHDKTISNAIGTFHENLIGGIDGFEKKPVGYGYDIRKLDNTLFAEIKNKHNTVKGEDKKGIHEKLSDFAYKYPNSTCYFVNIISKKSCNEIWSFSHKNKQYKHDRVRIVSGDEFYKIATGNPNAFKELCDILPMATKDVLKSTQLNNKVYEHNNNNSVYKELKIKSQLNSTDILTQIFNDTFNDYNGF